MIAINSLRISQLAQIAIIGLFAGILTLAGCLKPQTVKTAPQTNRLDQLLASAEAFEKQADYLKAREQCDHAREIDPRHAGVRACKERIDRALRRLADQKVRDGIYAAKEDRTHDANRKFLEAVELWPTHKQALRQIARLHPLPRTQFILYKIKPGDNLSTLALKYYDNSLYYPIIAEFNQINPDSKVMAGERLRIPKISGLPLHTHGAGLKTMVPAERKLAAYRAQGMAYIKAGKFSQAIARLKKALRMDKDDLATRQQLASAYYGLGRRLFDQKDYAKARACFLKGLSSDPGCISCQEGMALYRSTITAKHIDEGQRLFEADQLEAAAAELEKARKLDPDNQQIDDIISRGHYQKAEQLCAIKDFPAARKHFEMAAKLNPERFKDHDYERLCREAYLEIHYNRGISYYQNGQSRAAMAEWEKVSALDSNYKAVRYNMDLARLLKGLDD